MLDRTHFSSGAFEIIRFFPYSKSSLLSTILFFISVAPASLPAQTIHDGAVARESFTLHYKTIGIGRPLLLLSGGPGFDVDYMMPLAQEFSTSYQCILLEQRGTGRSQPPMLTPENANVAVMVEDIEALRDSMKVDKLVILGHSWGGILGMAYAAAHADRVDSLVLVASGGMDSSFGPIFMDNILTRATKTERQRISRIQDAMGSASDLQTAYLELFRLLVPLYFFDRDRGEQYMAAAKRESYHPQLAQLVQIDLWRNYNIHDRLRHFNPPVLIIQGRQDPMPESAALDSKATLPNSQLLFLNESGHFPWLEQPEVFYKSIRTFLRSER